jgi:hypothetical protein
MLATLGAMKYIYKTTTTTTTTTTTIKTIKF